MKPKAGSLAKIPMALLEPQTTGHYLVLVSVERYDSREVVVLHAWTRRRRGPVTVGTKEYAIPRDVFEANSREFVLGWPRPKRRPQGAAKRVSR